MPVKPHLHPLHRIPRIKGGKIFCWGKVKGMRLHVKSSTPVRLPAGLIDRCDSELVSAGR